MANKNNIRFFALVLIAVFCGLAAGVLGEIVTRVYLLKDFSVPYFSGELNLNDLNSNRSNLIIRDAKKVVVNQDLKVAETLNSLRPSLVGVFKTVSSSSEAYYNLEQPLIMGLVVTTDGWVVASVPSELKNSFNLKDYSVITSDRKIYQIDKIMVLKNFPGDATLFHLAGATNLAVKKIVSRADLGLGQSLLAVTGLNNIQPLTLTSLQKLPAVLNSETINARLELSPAASSLKNSFVFNLNGDLTALVSGQEEVIPAFSVWPLWQSVLKTNKNASAYFGVNYLDLSRIKPIGLNLEKGAWLYPSDKQAAVIKNSPAQLAGLQAGDVISWVDNQEINSGSDLADIIANYKPGDTITVTYWRSGLEQETELKLGTLK